MRSGVKEAIGGSVGFIGGAFAGGVGGNLLDRSFLHSGNLLSSPIDLPLLHHAELTGLGIWLTLGGALAGTAIGLIASGNIGHQEFEEVDYDRPGM